MTKRSKDEAVFAVLALLSFLLVGTIVVPGVISQPTGSASLSWNAR